MLPFRVGFNTDQHLPYGTLLERWQWLEDLGFDNLWVADHLLPWWTDAFHRSQQQVPWDDGVSGDEGAFLEGWTLLAALLARTARIRGGILVSNNLFRHPALVAKMATTLDHVSGGRFELGMGAGWFEAEHTTYGFEYPAAGERVARLAEALAIVDGMLTSERTTMAGAYYRVVNAPNAPRAVQQRIPLTVGASGTRMLGLVARYADSWGTEGSPEHVAARGAVLRAACDAIGRDPASIRWSLYAYNSTLGGDPFASVDAFRRIVEPYRAVGVSEVVFELPDHLDERVMEQVARELLPEWRAPVN